MPGKYVQRTVIKGNGKSIFEEVEQANDYVELWIDSR